MALILVACERSQHPVEGRNESATPAVSNVDDTLIETTRESASVPAEKAEGEKPDIISPELTPQAERGEKGARNVLLTFAQAIELRQFGQAWDLLSPADK